MIGLSLQVSEKSTTRENERLQIIKSVFGLQAYKSEKTKGNPIQLIYSGKRSFGTGPNKHIPNYEEFSQTGISSEPIVLFISEKRPNADEIRVFANKRVWWLCDGDPRLDPVGNCLRNSFADVKSRIAITIRKIGSKPDRDLILSFADAPRRPWDSLLDLQRRIDAFIPQLLEEAIESIAQESESSSAQHYADLMPKVQSRAMSISSNILDRFFDKRFFLNKIYGIRFLNQKFNELHTIALHNPAPDIFDDILSILGRRNNFVPYKEVVEAVLNGKRCAPGISVTFDDGYKENMLLLDILDKHKCSAMFFLNSCSIDSYRPAWFMNKDSDYSVHKPELRKLDFGSFLATTEELNLTKPCNLRKRFGLTGDNIKTLVDRGHSIGVHTHNHPFLQNLTESEIKKEILICRNSLSKILGNDNFQMDLAYPNGDFNDRVIIAVKNANVRSAATTIPAPVKSTTDPFEINRRILSDKEYPGVALMKLSPLYRRVKSLSLIKRNGAKSEVRNN